MDGMQVVLDLVSSWMSRMRKIVVYLRETFLPDEETKEDFGGLFWWI